MASAASAAAGPAVGGNAPFSFQVAQGIQRYRDHFGDLLKRNSEIKESAGKWEVLTRTFKKDQYPESEADLKSLMDSHVDTYLTFRQARAKAVEVFACLKTTIAQVTRTPVSEDDLDTLAQSGFPVKWAKKNFELRSKILPELEKLSKRVEAVKENIETEIKPAAANLNEALSYSCARLALATIGDSLRNVGSKAYLDRAIHERDGQPESPESPESPAPAECTYKDAERDFAEKEVARLEALLNELKGLTKSLDAPVNKDPQAMSALLLTKESELFEAAPAGEATAGAAAAAAGLVAPVSPEPETTTFATVAARPSSSSPKVETPAKPASARAPAAAASAPAASSKGLPASGTALPETPRAPAPTPTEKPPRRQR